MRAQVCGVKFRQYQLLPMGSFAHVADAGGAHPLHGPVHRLMCSSYDRAQVGFLACLREFAEWLRAAGATDEAGRPFELPQVIEGDKVGGLSVKLMFNFKDKAWTRALKYMLVDLKFAQKYFVAFAERGFPAARGAAAAAPRGGQPPPPGGLAALQREGHR